MPMPWTRLIVEYQVMTRYPIFATIAYLILKSFIKNNWVVFLYYA